MVYFRYTMESHMISCGITRYSTVYHVISCGISGYSTGSHRKIGRGESCESTSPVNYKECASVGLVVAMIQVSYTMPTCGVS